MTGRRAQGPGQEYGWAETLPAWYVLQLLLLIVSFLELRAWTSLRMSCCGCLIFFSVFLCQLCPLLPSHPKDSFEELEPLREESHQLSGREASPTAYSGTNKIHICERKDSAVTAAWPHTGHRFRATIYTHFSFPRTDSYPALNSLEKASRQKYSL